jgi:hypothetical protein
MEQFWYGFEKRALSPGLLGRAADKAFDKSIHYLAIGNTRLGKNKARQWQKFSREADKRLAKREALKGNGI